MQNFFNKSANPSPTPLNEQYDDMKDNYQQIFAEAVESIRSAINAFKPVEPCKTCVIKGCNIGEKDVFTQYPSGCAYKEWQMQVISYLTGDYYQKLQMPQSYQELSYLRLHHQRKEWRSYRHSWGHLHQLQR